MAKSYWNFSWNIYYPAIDYSGGSRDIPNGYEWVHIVENDMPTHCSSILGLFGVLQGIKLLKNGQKSPEILSTLAVDFFLPHPTHFASELQAVLENF